MPFTPRVPGSVDPLTDTARYNCPCGRWITLARVRTESEPLICACGRKHYWVKPPHSKPKVRVTVPINTTENQ